MKLRCKVNRRRFAARLIIYPIVLILVVLGPSLVACAWHLTHSRTQRFEGFEISVPASFFFSRKEDEAWLLRGRTILSKSPYRFELVKIRRHNGPINIDLWKARGKSTFIQKGETGVETYDLPFAGSQIYCIEMDEHAETFRRSAICGDARNFIIQYFGDRDGRSEIQDALRDVKYANP